MSDDVCSSGVFTTYMDLPLREFLGDVRPGGRGGDSSSSGLWACLDAKWWKQCRMKLAKEQGDGSPVLGEASQASEVGKITCLGKYAGKSLLLLHSKKVSWKQGCSGWGKRLCAKHISIHLSLVTSFSLFEKLHCYFFSKYNLFVCLFFLSWGFLTIAMI